MESDTDKPYTGQDRRQRARHPEHRRKAEWRSFLFLTVVMAPVLTVIVVGGYGFAVWMYQLLNGPPSY